MRSPFETARHLLVIQPLVGIGDMVWHKPWIDELSGRYRLTLACKPTTFPDVLFPASEHPQLNTLIIERSLRGRKGRHDGLSGFLRLVADFRRTGADTAILMHHSARYALAARLAGIKVRLGYGLKKSGRHLNAGTILTDTEMRGVHAVDRIALFASRNGFGLENPEWRLTPQPQDMTTASVMLRDHDIITSGGTITPYFIFGIDAMHDERCWKAERFAALADMLADSSLNRPVILLHAPSSRPVAEKIREMSARHQQLIILNTSFGEAVALMSLSSGFIGNDSAPLNIMACLSKPALGLFSQSRPLTYSPHIHSLDMFTSSDYGTPGLIHRIPPEAVFSRMSQIWS